MTDAAKHNALGAANKPRHRTRGRVRRLLVAVTGFVLSLLFFGVVVSVASVFCVREVPVRVRSDSSVQVTEITHLYPVTMRRVVVPGTVAEIAAAVKSSHGPIAI